MSYLDELQGIAESDVKSLLESEKSYKDSWKKRGGVGAFMMLARKWDRIENAMTSEHAITIEDNEVWRPYLQQYDIFARTEEDNRPEGIIDDIQDLRRYLMLVEAEMISRKKN